MADDHHILQADTLIDRLQIPPQSQLRDRLRSHRRHVLLLDPLDTPTSHLVALVLLHADEGGQVRGASQDFGRRHDQIVERGVPPGEGVGLVKVTWYDEAFGGLFDRQCRIPQLLLEHLLRDHPFVPADPDRQLQDLHELHAVGVPTEWVEHEAHHAHRTILAHGSDVDRLEGVVLGIGVDAQVPALGTELHHGVGPDGVGLPHRWQTHGGHGEHPQAFGNLMENLNLDRVEGGVVRQQVGELTRTHVRQTPTRGLHAARFGVIVLNLANPRTQRAVVQFVVSGLEVRSELGGDREVGLATPTRPLRRKKSSRGRGGGADGARIRRTQRRVGRMGVSAGRSCQREQSLNGDGDFRVHRIPRERVFQEEDPPVGRFHPAICSKFAARLSGNQLRDSRPRRLEVHIQSPTSARTPDLRRRSRTTEGKATAPINLEGQLVYFG